MPTTKQSSPRNEVRPVVAHVASRYYSLTENWIHTQVKYLSDYQAAILTLETENLNGDSQLEYYALHERSKVEQWFNAGGLRLWGYYPGFQTYLKRWKPQVIHAHFGHRSYRLALPLAKKSNIPLVTTFYGHDVSKLPQKNSIWQARYKDLFQHGACFLAEGSHMARQLIALGCPPEKVKVQHLGIELDSFTFRPRTFSVNTPLRLLTAGRFTEKKGIVYAVEACAHLIRMGVDCRLTVIGDAGKSLENQATKHEILKTIQENNLDQWITLRGMQPHAELKRAYYDHHIFLAPSVQAKNGNNEGGAPVTIIEAAATGMPVVGSYHCDIPEVVRHGETGLLAPERNSAALAEHLLTFVEQPMQIETMGAAARRHIETEYDAAEQGRRLETIYQEVIWKANGNHGRPTNI